MGPGSPGLSAAETVMVESTEVVGMMKAIVHPSIYTMGPQNLHF